MEKLTTGQLSLLSLQLLYLIQKKVDPVLDLLSLSFVPGWASFPTYISVTEEIDIVIELSNDHVVEVLVIKALAIAGNGAGDLIVVKVDVDLFTVLVEE